MSCWVFAEGVMSFCHLYRDEVRAALASQGQNGVTMGEALLYQQKGQYHLVLQWLEEQFAQGVGQWLLVPELAAKSRITSLEGSLSASCGIGRVASSAFFHLPGAPKG